jgi:hypothetical protein
VTGDDIVRKVDERIAELHTALADIEAEIARNSAVHREQAERLGRDMDAIQAEISRRGRRAATP